MSTSPPSVRDHCLAPERVEAAAYGGRYRSLLEDLPPLRVDESALHALGRPGGPCVDFAGDTDSGVASVWPFFGQFIAHAHRYRKGDPAKLLLSPSGRDVPRNHEGIALVGDPRNDVHRYVSQMQVAFIELHDRLVDRLRELLPGLIGADLTAELLEDGPRPYRMDGEPYELADAAYGCGDAQIRDRHRVNEHFGPCPLYPDLMGFGPVAPEHAVDVPLQFEQRAERIDARLPNSLIALPTQISGAAQVGLADVLVPA